VAVAAIANEPAPLGDDNDAAIESPTNADWDLIDQNSYRNDSYPFQRIGNDTMHIIVPRTYPTALTNECGRGS
jgi:hypothetical protein